MPAAVTPLPSPRPGSPLVSAAGGWSGAPTPSQAEALPLDLSFSGSPLGGVLQDSILLFTTVRGINARARVRACRWSSLPLCHFNGCWCCFSFGVAVPRLVALLGLPVAFLPFRRISEGIPRRRESLPDVLTISAASGVPWLPLAAIGGGLGRKIRTKKERAPAVSGALSGSYEICQAVMSWPLVPWKSPAQAWKIPPLSLTAVTHPPTLAATRQGTRGRSRPTSRKTRTPSAAAALIWAAVYHLPRKFRSGHRLEHRAQPVHLPRRNIRPVFHLRAVRDLRAGRHRLPLLLG